MESTCPTCQTTGPVTEHVRRVGSVYYVDRTFTSCGHVDTDTEGGV